MATRITTKPTSKTQAIAERAHELFLLRGCEHGHDLDDWLTAESEIAAKKPAKARMVTPKRTVKDRSAA
jgi:Protein of unknown function (DUF2934)